MSAQSEALDRLFEFQHLLNATLLSDAVKANEMKPNATAIAIWHVDACGSLRRASVSQALCADAVRNV